MKRLRPLAALLGAALITTLAAVVPAAHAAARPADWYAYHGSRYRHGVSTTMPAVRAPLSVAYRRALDGKVYASPLVLGGVTIVATENDSVYAFGPNYNVLWKRHLGSPASSSELPCGNIFPLGITGTPVYGAKYHVIYVAAEFGSPVRHRLFALALGSGATRWSRSLDLPGVQTNAMQQRGALTVTGRRVWVPFGGLAGDCGGYKGRVVGYYRSGSGSAASFTVPTAREAGIWTPPGPVLDQYGQMYVSVGNGASGTGDRYDHSDSVLKLGLSGDVRGSFSPSSWAYDNDHDLDLGSLGPTLLSGNRWVFAAGKSGYGYVLRRAALGGVGGAIDRRYVCQAFGGTASYGSTAYLPCTDGIRAVSVGPNGNIAIHWHTRSSITGSPVIGGGRLWALDPSGGTLFGLDPNTGAVRNAISVGATSRFATPALYGNHVIVPTLSGITVVRTS